MVMKRKEKGRPPSRQQTSTRTAAIQANLKKKYPAKKK